MKFFKHNTLFICLIFIVETSIGSQQQFPVWQLIVLGMAQDAGYPQAGCQKECCNAYWAGKQKKQYATCLGLLNTQSKEAWLFEATPDIKDQLHVLDSMGFSLSGIFLTHAHIGHYAGLIHLGREVMGTEGVPVYVMPKMKVFLENNGPWSQLVQLNNISLNLLTNEVAVSLANNMSITPVLVPHRDEFSETVGYQISGPNNSVLFIPDINKWEEWDKDIAEEIQKVNYAFIDASFFDANELPGRDMSKIPHPFTTESMELLDGLSKSDKSKVHFIHFNHTNPAMFDSPERKQVIESGFNIVKQELKIEL